MERAGSPRPLALGLHKRPHTTLALPPRPGWLATALVAAISTMAVLSAQQPVFRSGTDAVRVDVLVTDRRGVPVPALQPRDFVLRDAGVAQQIVTASFEELPLHVVLALDTSASVEGESFERLVAAARGLLEQLRPADAATLVVFSNVIALQPLSEGRADRAEAELRRLQAIGSTAVFDATWVSLIGADRPGFRSLVVLLSDGFDNRSWLELDEVLEAAKRVEAVVYCVRVQPRIRSVPNASPRRYASSSWIELQPRNLARTVPPGTRRFLELLAEESGGRVLRADTDVDVRPSLMQVLEEFRRRYVLTFVPEGVERAGWHPIEVTVKGKAAKVTARRGYQRDWPATQ